MRRGETQGGPGMRLLKGRPGFRTHFLPCWFLAIRCFSSHNNKQTTKDGEDVDKKQPLPTAGNISESTVEIDMENPHKLKIGLLCDAATPPPSITQKSDVSKSHTHFTAALFTAARSGNQPVCT